MMKRTHQAFAGVFWLSGTLAADFVSVHLGHGEVVSAGMVALGWPLAVPLSAGRNSPDMDQMWWPGPPRCEPGSQRRYYWRGHRGLTHRVWFACVVTVALLAVPLLVASRIGPLSWWLAELQLALISGWWSHLAGDMIYGRIRIAGRARGLGWRTGGLSETGTREHGGHRWVIDPAAKVCAGLCAALVVAHVLLLSAAIR
jgi:hypothetical protein